MTPAAQEAIDAARARADQAEFAADTAENKVGKLRRDLQRAERFALQLAITMVLLLIVAIAGWLRVAALEGWL